MSDDVELNGLEVKPYIHSQKNCRPSAYGYVMEPINSNLEIDLTSFSDNIMVVIITKRISGNGKVKINDENYEVLSKENNHLELNLSSDKILKFKRESDSIGKIIISNIKIITRDVQTDLNPGFLGPKPLNINPENWQNLLIKGGKIKGVKLNNNRLLASEGAFIENASYIEYIETNPPKSFKRSNIIKFIYPCEITAISFSDGFDPKKNSLNKYKHFNAPPALQTSQINMQDNNILSNTLNSINAVDPINNVLYDSFISPLNAQTLNSANEIITSQGKNNNGILLKRFGVFSIPLSILQPDMQYVIVVNVKKISGNGKFGVAIETTEGIQKSSIIKIAPDREMEMHLLLNTESPPSHGNTYLLKIFRPEDSSVGDVLIDHLMVIRGITINSNSNILTKIKASTDNAFHLIDKNESDPIRAVSKKYSIVRPTINLEQKFDFKGEISIKSKSASNWYHKIKTAIPNIKVVKDAKVVIGELGLLIPADKIWLNAFHDTKISDSDHNILKNAKMILTPSLQNSEFLKKIYPEARVDLLEKTWPMITPTTVKMLPQSYTVMFHRNDLITSRVVESYDNTYPPLVLIGSNKYYHGNIIQLNEYISYDKILYTLLNAKLLIDIPEYDDYYSGILSLAFDNGIPVVTSNWFGLGKTNCKFIITKDKINELNIPKTNDIKNGIIDGLNLNKLSINNNHNEKLNKILLILFN